MRTPQYLVDFRHDLHRRPDTAGEEKHTAEAVKAYFQAHHPEFQLRESIGGHGMIFSKYYGPGEEVALRAELDALPILETGNPPYKSEIEGKSHVCGHDGHMTILLDTVRKIEEIQPNRGALHVLFQPAEETGQGARRMLDSKAMDGFHPDVMYALHNIPGQPLGRVLGVNGNFACGSTGVKINIRGKTAHAAHPEDAVNPLIIAVSILDEILSLIDGNRLEDFSLATPIALQSGEDTFGTSPAKARLLVTLRAVKKVDLEYLMQATEKIAARCAGTPGATSTCEFVDFFPIVKNPPLTEVLKNACDAAGVDFAPLEAPFRWSEDFGFFQKNFRAYMFGLGSGKDQPALHAPDFDFPDALLDVGSSVFFELFKAHTQT